MSSPGVDDLYALLGVPADAPAQEVKRAYRRIALRSHPDVNKAADAAAQFNALTQAYRTLIDPEKRRAYDMRRARRAPGASRGWSARTPTGGSADSADERAARAASASRRRAADGPMPEDLGDSFGSIFGDVLKGVGKFVSELETGGAGGLEDWLSYVETSATAAATAGGTAASWAAEGDALDGESDEGTLREELADLAFLARQLEERRLRLQEEVLRGETLAVELLSRARETESAARRAAATERAVAVRREAAATRAQCEAVLAHAYRVRARKERLEERLAQVQRPPPPPPGSPRTRSAPARGTGVRSADFAARVDDDLRELKERLGRKE
ncbi:hypothetical protein KFE25_009432 [Diacronema lutheri]|uniref:J domain-containing protein n=2 Tax=Diacronema lutheri TaxID=2081491 RepID=A0A8J5XKI8_DIALT|nr:hypothetical protein KFE25_009432 [Diacronema lutheri]